MPFSNPFRRAKKEKTAGNAEVPDNFFPENPATKSLANGKKATPVMSRQPLHFHTQVSCS